MRWSHITDKGLVRLINEDSVCICPDLGLFAVADGMGGHQAGEVASRLAVEGLERFLRSKLYSHDRIDLLLLEGVRQANRLVYQSSFQYDGYKGMGTTLSCIIINDKQLYLAHVGDSRIYLLYKGNIVQLTEDHSVVQEMVKRGNITREQARVHPYRHVLTRALGVEPVVEVDAAFITVYPGNLLLLCTDGLTNHIEDQEIYNIIYKKGDLNRAISELIDTAISRGGTDNISIILVAVE